MQNSIVLNVQLNEEKIPQEISWHSSSNSQSRKVKAFLLSLWDEEENNSYKIDLWTTQMQKQEMIQFMEQSLLSLADTLAKSTNCPNAAKSLRSFSSQLRKEALEEISR